MTATAPVVPEGLLHAHGFSWRKRGLLRAFTARDDIHFLRPGQAVPMGASLLLWGSAPVPAGVNSSVPIVRVEDGFLRSVGLGADLTQPLSWVIDPVGIYYDATRPSSLEQLLQSAEFGSALIEQARTFRERVVHAGLTKYNLAAAPWRRPSPDRLVVLVAGQVETDASIRLGAREVRSNLALLQAVRGLRPDAYVVYKPHPDVVAGLRQQGQGEDQAMKFCDEVLTEGAMDQLLGQVDEVHVITSLTGFEALMRGKTVYCHGQPFYAGWGLTADCEPVARRTRRLSLNELVAGALLLYPRYLSRVSGRLCSPAQALDELVAWRASQPAALSWWRRWLRPLIARA